MLPEHSYSAHWETGGLDWSALERSSAVSALVVSSSGRLLAANAAFADLLRMGSPGDVVGRSVADLFVDADDWKCWSDLARSGKQKALDVRFRRSDGETVFMRGDVTALPDGPRRSRLLGLFVDGSEAQQLRRALQRSARLEALGSLTSGVAHDFNNLLTVLVGNLSLLAEDLRAQPEQFSKLKAARDAAKRGADLIRQLLAFARHQPVEADLVRPAKVVEGIVPLLSRALGARVRLEKHIEAEGSAVRGNLAQLESVIVNLAVNARDALGSGGKVVIGVSDVMLNGADAGRHGLTAGNYVRVSVADDGAGIDGATLPHVFEPFFSTKTDRGGTGLGLSMVRTYASQFAGAAYIASEVGKGTTVSLLFPRCAEGAEETAAKTMPLSTLPTGHEQILVLTSDEGVRSTLSQILEVLGYSVRLTSDVREAAAIVRGKGLDLLIVDAMFADSMPPSGRTRVLLLTSSGDAGRGKDVRTLAKPFALADLAQTVRAALDASKD